MKTVLMWVGIAVGVLFGYLAVRHIRLAEVWDALAASNYWWLVPSFAALAVGNVMRACRWRYLFIRETRPPLAPVLSAMLIGQFFNNILPARAGEAARVVALNQSSRTSRAETIGTVVVERQIDVLSVLVLLFVLVPWLPHVTWIRSAAVLAIALAAGLLAAIVLVGYLSSRPAAWPLRLLDRISFIPAGRARRAVAHGMKGMAALVHPRLAAGALLWTLSSWGVFGLSAWFVMRGFGLGLSPVAGLLVMITTALAMILPSPPAAVGVFEAAALLALRAYHVPGAQALSYALVLHAVNFFPYVAAGLVLLRTHALSVRRAAVS